MKRAVVLFNLGGPDSPEAVRPFLFNLFNDGAIIGVPQPLRWLLAKLISGRRAPVAREIYANLGGKSPLLDLTRAQADALEAALAEAMPGDEVKVAIAMRYWHPFADETAREVAAFRPDEVVLLPLYPQFSTTTTGSSVADWHRAAARAGLAVPHRTVCCYPVSDPFIGAHAASLRPFLEGEARAGKRVLFSAHGLPKRVVERGDPYQWQVERTVDAIVEALGMPGLDYVTCYQSRVGPLEWIGPSTEDEIARAGADGKALVVVPVAFVSEHSETLVELDIEYAELAQEAGVPSYERVPALGTALGYVAALADAVMKARPGIAPEGGTRLCPAAMGKCPCMPAD